MVQHADIDHTGLTGVGGSVASDAIFDAKGDLPVGTGANTAQKLTVGTNGHVLTADSGETTGVKWAAAPAAALTKAVATVATNQTQTGNNSYADLATAGPAVTITVNTAVMVIVSCEVSWTSTGAADRYAVMAYAVSGANTIAAARGTAYIVVGEPNDNGSGGSASRVSILTGLTPGSTTFTAKYNQFGTGGTANYQNREIAVICLD